MKTIGIIPARFQSSRFPGKPLVDLAGKSMIRRVYERAAEAPGLDELVVATDDKRIASHVEAFGGRVVMTGADLASGTDRCAAVVHSWNGRFPYDRVVNIQGDEPLLQPAQIGQLLALFADEDCQIATLARRLEPPADPANPNLVKVVTDRRGRALYFSRAPIPYPRAPVDKASHLHHVGLYAFRTEALLSASALPLGELEQTESLEQLRWLENGFSIYVGLTEYPNWGVDSPEDVGWVLKKLRDELL